MKENYNLVINSQTATNRIGTLKRSYQYYINWSTVLPKPENINQQFLVKFACFGLAQSNFAECYSISINFGGTNVYDTLQSRTNTIRIAYPFYSGSFAYLTARPPDSPEFSIEYPNNDFITATFTNINVSSGVVMYINYILTLQFTPI